MSIKKNSQKTKCAQGFLLPDVMIAVFITATALVALLAAMTPLFASEFFKRDEIIATGLAQEGIEMTRNLRDRNWKASQPGFGGSFPADGTYCKDSAATSFAACSASNQHLTPDNNTGLYKTDGSGAGKFQRTITIATSGSDRVVTSVVSFVSGGSTHQVTLKSTLTDWGNK